MPSNSGKFSDEDVIDANQRLLNAISSLDFDTYEELCAKDLTAIEPESLNNPVHGLQFHKYYFDLYKHPHLNKNKEEQQIIPTKISMASPHVRWLGGGCCSDGCGEGTAAVLTYIRLDQSMAFGNEAPTTKTSSETRIWENRDGKLINVHFHKS